MTKLDKPSLGIDFVDVNGIRNRNVQFLYTQGQRVVAIAIVDFEDDAETRVMCVEGIRQGDVIDAAKKFLGIGSTKGAAIPA